MIFNFVKLMVVYISYLQICLNLFLSNFIFYGKTFAAYLAIKYNTWYTINFTSFKPSNLRGPMRL